MKLQTPKQANTAIQEERRTQISEGLTLAKKVDALRETLASLEAQHQKFLAGLGKELDDQTKSKKADLESIKGEIISLEEKRKLLMKPLDEEWMNLEEAKITHSKQVELLVERDERSREKEKSIAKEERSLAQKGEALISKEEEITKVSQETIELYEKAKSIKEAKDKEYEAHKQEVSKGVRELQARETAVTTREILCKNREGILELREIELNNKDRAITDKYNTLLRTINRLKK